MIFLINEKIRLENEPNYAREQTSTKQIFSICGNPKPAHMRYELMDYLPLMSLLYLFFHF